mmetsp:Transcript_15364/g.23799  ORF Transcript_15364/g.23799 Transcript_15364/m.23799 type:complete len:289 (+) Transcript_15364:475-1341(+)|eukprot:CAMPEP_0196801940 /NCGR_PEP_ID=MMETSP1362-20130617/1705_1 /TAXON_ID=163516 /ORGANISM="Leptocylindrus danicus, Strain CCMP1856" /LENGTH=288 /DNA_ID=CAMNT_0042173129 /DNA_START=475 /DNA_END=1341 /DNA_ORIENTATION=-
MPSTKLLLKKRRLEDNVCLEESGRGPNKKLQYLVEAIELSLGGGRGAGGELSIIDLPKELFGKVVSFIGPCSSALLHLAGSSRYFQKLLNDMGGRMLVKSNFRVPLPRFFLESDISHFIRHTRACRETHDMLSRLDVYVKTEFENISEVSDGLSLAFRLLDQRCSRPLEQKLLSLCGKCGGKAFKFCKQVQHSDGIDKSRLVMQLVLFRELQISKEEHVRFSNTTGEVIGEATAMNGVLSISRTKQEHQTSAMLSEILRRGSILAARNGERGIFTEPQCVRSVFIEDI